MKETVACRNRFYRALGHLTCIDVSFGFPKWYFKGRSCLKMQEDAQVGSATVKKGSPFTTVYWDLSTQLDQALVPSKTQILTYT